MIQEKTYSIPQTNNKYMNVRKVESNYIQRGSCHAHYMYAIKTKGCSILLSDHEFLSHKMVLIRRMEVFSLFVNLY